MENQTFTDEKNSLTIKGTKKKLSEKPDSESIIRI
jgi:hypothetical protein